MNPEALTSAYLAWERWCKTNAKKKWGRASSGGRAESARLVSELVAAADELGTTHTLLRERIVEELRSGKSIPDAVAAATM